MTTWYVHSNVTGADTGGLTGYDTSTGSLGSDSNSGLTAAAPFLTLTKLATVMQNGDTANLAGRFRFPDATLTAFSMTTATGRTFQQWSGQAPFDLRGDNLIPIDTAWTQDTVDAGNGTYSTTITAALGTGYGNTLAACMFDYDLAENLDSDGRHVTHFRRVASKALCTDVGTYFYNNTTGELTVHCKFDQDPTSSVQIHYSRRGRNGFLNTDSGNASGSLTFSSLRFSAFADNTAQKGCCIMVPGCTGNRYNDCVFDDYGFHAITHNGGSDVNNIDTDCIYRGCPPGGAAIAFYADAGVGPGAVAVTSCQSVRGLFYLNTFIGIDSGAESGAPVEQGSVITSIIVHGSVSGAGAVKIINPRTIQYTFSDGSVDVCSPYDCSGAGTASVSDPSDPDNFAIQIIQTDPDIFVIDNGTTQLSVNQMVFVNCKMRFQNFGVSGLTGCLGDYYPAQTSPFNTSIYYYGCDIQINQSKLTGPTKQFNCGLHVTLGFINTSVLDTSTTTGAGVASSHAVIGFNDTTGGGGNTPGSAGNIYARKSIFAYRTAAAAGNDERRFITGDDDTSGPDIVIPDENLDIQDCLIYNVTAGKYSAVSAGGSYVDGSTITRTYSARNTSALWFSAIDPNGFELSMQPFADVKGESTLDLRTFGNAWDARKTVSTDIENDVRGINSDGGYGCYFYGRDLALNGSDGILDVNASQIGGVDAPSPYSYIPRVGFIRTTTTDSYIVIWYRNGYLPAEVDSPITGTPTIQVFDSSGSELVATSNLTQADDDVWGLTTTNQIPTGETAYALIEATIDGETRIFKEPVGRDRSI